MKMFFLIPASHFLHQPNVEDAKGVLVGAVAAVVVVGGGGGAVILPLKI